MTTKVQKWSNNNRFLLTRLPIAQIRLDLT